MAPTPITWPLEPDPPSPTPTPATTSTESATAKLGQLAFLGFGVLRPFRRDEKNDFAHAGGRRLLDARIGQILGTKADTVTAPGEVPWRTDFGSRLHILRHRNNSEILAELAAELVAEALEKWEKNVVVTGVVVEKTDNPRKLLLRVSYTVVDQRGASLVSGEATVPIG